MDKLQKEDSWGGFNNKFQPASKIQAILKYRSKKKNQKLAKIMQKLTWSKVKSTTLKDVKQKLMVLLLLFEKGSQISRSSWSKQKKSRKDY